MELPKDIAAILGVDFSGNVVSLDASTFSSIVKPETTTEVQSSPTINQRGVVPSRGISTTGSNGLSSPASTTLQNSIASSGSGTTSGSSGVTVSSEDTSGGAGTTITTSEIINSSEFYNTITDIVNNQFSVNLAVILDPYYIPVTSSDGESFDNSPLFVKSSFIGVNNVNPNYAIDISAGDVNIGLSATTTYGYKINAHNVAYSDPSTNRIILGETYNATAGNTDLYTIELNRVHFDTADSLSEGVLSWNNTDGTADLKLKGGNVTLQIGQEQVVRVVNKTGATLNEADFRVVRVRSISEGGAQGQRLAVKLARGDSDADSATTIGVVTETITNNQEGFITISGNVSGINTTGAKSYGGTESWVDGDILYLSPDHEGYLTKVKPQAPQHTVIVGWVVYSHANNGKIFVKVDNGYEIDELHNVSINSVLNNQTLVYSTTDNTWKNKTLINTQYYLPVSDGDKYIDSPVRTSTDNVNVGIGKTPSYKLDVNGDINISSGSLYRINGAQLSTTYVLEGTNLYFTNARVRSTALTGLSTTTSGAIVASDTVLQAFGKIQAQINALSGSANFQGTWNANTNTPTITSGTGTKGYYYIVSVAGTTTIDGISTWNVGDWIVYNGTAWERIAINAVISVNGSTGVVVLHTDDIAENTGATNLWYTDTRARASISSSATGLTYTSSTGVFSLTTGYSIPTTVKQGEWDSAYTFTNAFPSRTGNSGKYLTTNGTTMSWSSIVTGVSSVFGRTGDVVAVDGDYDIDELGDVTITSVANNQLLKYDSTSSKWVNWTATYISSASLSTLTDVTISSVANNQLLRYNSTTSKWVNFTPTYLTSVALSNLTDVTITSLLDTQLLKYDSASSKWINFTPTYISSAAISSLTDVSISSIADGNLLQYTAGTTNKWQNKSLATIFTSAAISTVVSSNLTVSRALVSNSSGKIAVSAVTSTELGYLSGVTSAIQTQIDSKFSNSGGNVNGEINPIGIGNRPLGTATTPINTAGWFVIGKFTGTGERGGKEITLSFTGGSYSPVTYKIYAWKDWLTNTTLKLEKFGIADYITDVRIIQQTSDSDYYIEINCASNASGLSFYVYYENIGYDDEVTLYTGVLTAGATAFTLRTELPFVDKSTSLEGLYSSGNINLKTGGTYRINDTQIGLTNLGDITITSVADNQLLKYNASSGKWINWTPTFTSDLDSLTDVVITSPQNNDYLVYNTANTRWENKQISASSFFTVTENYIPIGITGGSIGDSLIRQSSSTIVVNTATTTSFTDPISLQLYQAKDAAILMSNPTKQYLIGLRNSSTTGNSFVIFDYTSNAYRFALKSTGNLVIGQLGEIEGGKKFQVAGDINITGNYYINGNLLSTTSAGGNVSATEGTLERVAIFATNYSSSSGVTIKNSTFYATGGRLGIGDVAPVGYNLYVVGSVGATAYYETSDIRFKTIIEVNPKLNLSSIDVIKYTRTNSDKIRYGYSAQQVKSVCSDFAEGDDVLTLNYLDIHTMKIKELEDKIKELEEKLNSK